MTRTRAFLLCFSALFASAQTIELTPVVSRPVSRTVELPGEFQPYLSVALRAKVPGFVEKMLVDRGSVVKEGQLLVSLSAPEMAARIAEDQSRVQAAQADQLQAEAQLEAAKATLDRLKTAAQTPGAVAGNEIVQVQKQVDAAEAIVRSRRQSVGAAEAVVKANQELQSYLQISAPFDGIVTDRLVHPGALVGGANDSPLLVIQQISRLRLIAPVPEEDAGGIAAGAKVEFHVPAYPDRSYTGTVARISHALDPKTRTMPVELDVSNPDNSLAPGMFPSLKWPVRRSRPSVFVPRTAVVTTTERTFVIRDNSGRAQWVDVRKGSAEGDLIEAIGPLKPGDRVVKRATDEIREGNPLK